MSKGAAGKMNKQGDCNWIETFTQLMTSLYVALDINLLFPQYTL